MIECSNLTTQFTSLSFSMLLLLVFGAKRLPEMGKSLGAGLRGFKDSISGEAPTDQAHGKPPHDPFVSTTRRDARETGPTAHAGPRPHADPASCVEHVGTKN